MSLMSECSECFQSRTNLCTYHMLRIWPGRASVLNVDVADKKSKRGLTRQKVKIRTTKSPIPGEKVDSMSWRKSQREGRWRWRTGGEDSGETNLGQLDKKSRVGSVQDDRKSNPRHEEIQRS